MARYHFETEDGRRHLDPNGLDFATLDDVRREAVKATCEVVREYADEFWQDGEFKMIVKDERGLILFCLDLSYVPAAALSGRT